MIIKIPFKTPSVNHLYGHNRYGRLFLKPEAKKLRDEIIKLCDSSNALNLQYSKLSVSIEIYENWRYKNGQLKKSDVSNREKFLIDSVFEGLNLDDKWIVEISIKKREPKEIRKDDPEEIKKIIKEAKESEFAVILIEESSES